MIRLPDPKYLNRLFTIIIVAIVGTCASFFKEFVSPRTSPVVIQSDTNKASPVVLPFLTNQPTPNPLIPVPEKGWIGFRHSGGYVAKFYVNWKENGQPKSWKSGNKTAGYSDVVWLNGNVSEVKITAQAATGIAWDAWATIFKLETNVPPNKTFVAQGTTLKRKWAMEDRMP
jgi:hypothetical protein